MEAERRRGLGAWRGKLLLVLVLVFALRLFEYVLAIHTIGNYSGLAWPEFGVVAVVTPFAIGWLVARMARRQFGPQERPGTVFLFVLLSLPIPYEAIIWVALVPGPIIDLS